jgi:hypothetical protein
MTGLSTCPRHCPHARAEPPVLCAQPTLLTPRCEEARKRLRSSRTLDCDGARLRNLSMLPNRVEAVTSCDPSESPRSRAQHEPLPQAALGRCFLVRAIGRCGGKRLRAALEGVGLQRSLRRLTPPLLAQAPAGARWAPSDFAHALPPLVTKPRRAPLPWRHGGRRKDKGPLGRACTAARAPGGGQSEGRGGAALAHRRDWLYL